MISDQWPVISRSQDLELRIQESELLQLLTTGHYLLTPES